MRFTFAVILLLAGPSARAKLCNASEDYCGLFKGSSSSAPAAPSRENTVRINPSSVPIEKGFGIGSVIFDGVDFGVVKGLGRVGAAISPSNSEETFFGPPGVELPQDYLKRKQNQKKYPSQKVTLSTAFGLIKGSGSGLRRFELNVGVMAKYNRLTRKTTPGGGVTGVLGPFTFGYSLYRDQTQIDYTPSGLAGHKSVTDFNVETYSAAMFLSSLAVDYSILRMITNDVATTSVLTASLLLKKCMLTASVRREHSYRPAYNSTLLLLEQQKDKSDVFAGVQFNFLRSWMLGVFYNYYVLHELSLGATYFF